MSTATLRPEIHGALSLAEYHRQVAEYHQARRGWKTWRVRKHESKAQKLERRAARLAGKEIAR